MRLAVCFIYVFCQLAYLMFQDGGRIWGGFNIITHISFVGYLCYLIEQYTSGSERLFFIYLKYLSLINCLYIITCVVKGRYWSFNNIDFFAFVLGIGIAAFLIYRAFKKS